MSDNLNNFITMRRAEKFATNAGVRAHKRMQHIGYKNGLRVGDAQIWANIDANPELTQFFVPTSQTEVPIAGYIHKRFVSRRIDRMVVDDATQTILILDYKTDITPNDFRDKYITQIGEYIALMQAVFPEYQISGYILWLHEWRLDKIA